MPVPTPFQRALRALRLAVALVTPHGYYVARDAINAKRHDVWRTRNAAWRERTLEAGRARAAADRATAFSVEAAVQFHVARGLPEPDVRDGSMSPADLEAAAVVLREHLPAGRPVRGLQIGNFVGVSLAFFSHLMRERHPDSVMVSVDPDISHRRIERPQRHVLALLGHFDLLRSNTVITGYSLEQNLGENPGGDAADHLRTEQASEDVLAQLARIAPERFDLVVLDGNHIAAYLRRETEATAALLAPGALVVIDDVDPGYWPEVVAAYDEAAAGRFAEVARIGHVGILTLAAGDTPPTAAR